MGTEETTIDLNQVMEEGMAKFQEELDLAAREPEDGGRTSEDGGRPEDGGPATDDAREPEAGTTETGDQPPEEDGEPGDTAGTREGETQDEPEPEGREGETPPPVDNRVQLELDRIRQENARLRADLETARTAEAMRKAQGERDEKLLEFMEDQHEKAQEEIDNLDPEDEGYRKAVARVWARNELAVEAWKRDNPVSVEAPAPSEDGGRPEDGGRTAEDGGRPDGGREPEGQASDGARAWGDVESLARNDGIDPSDDYFQMICTYAPDRAKDGHALTFEEQVGWAVQKTKDYHQKQERQFRQRQEKAAREKSEHHQAENLPLGASPATRSAPKPEDVPPVTLDDAIESAKEERRL